MAARARGPLIVVPSVVIAAGGTGGHLVPALTIADAIRARHPDVRITFVGTKRGLETTLVPEAGYPIETTPMAPFDGGPKGFLSTIPAILTARRILRRVGATVVLGMGGYPSLPVVAAARLSGVPAVIHESNVIPGLANDVCAKMTSNVAVAFPQARASLPRARVTGMPLRLAFDAFDRNALRDEAAERFGLDRNRSTALIFGGSLGAARINAAAIDLVSRWSEREDVQVLIGSGRTHAQSLAEQIDPKILRVVVEPYIDRMDLAYAIADVVVSRAGSQTVAELASTGTPSILVPLPIARRREQHANAGVMTAAGGAIMVEDAELDGAWLAAELDGLLVDAERLRAMGAAARTVAVPQAADALASWVLELGGAP